MADLIRDLLLFARPRPPARSEALQELVRRTMALLWPMAAKAGVKLNSEVVRSVRVFADAAQLE